MESVTLMKILGEQIRKLLAGALGAAMLLLIQKGVITQGQWDQWLELTASMLAFVAVAAWTRWILPWLKRLFNK